MKKILQLIVLLICSAVLTGCQTTTSPSSTSSEIAPPSTPDYMNAVNLYKGVKQLSDKLSSSPNVNPDMKIAVADFVGPGRKVYVLGEHISNKISVKLYEAGTFRDFMERKQLRQLLQNLEIEHSGYFDEQTVKQYGKLIGVDAMVIGTIEDLKSALDVTAKIVDTATGRVLSIADSRINKDTTVNSLLYKDRLTSLTVSVRPPTNGTAVVCGKQANLQNGIAKFSKVPYGNCQAIIQPQGSYEQIRRNISIYSPNETRSFDLTKKTRKCFYSFQVIPPDAVLSVDGEVINLNDQGFAKIPDLNERPYSFFVQANGYSRMAGSFNPCNQSNQFIELQTSDPFYNFKDSLFKKVQALAGKNDFSVKLWTNKKNYQIGDTISFTFRSEQSCYLYLVDINSNGDISLIFPNQFHTDNYVLGGKTYKIPDDYNFSFEVEPPLGTDRVYAIASTRPLNLFQTNFRKDKFYTLTRGVSQKSMVRGIGVKLDQAELNAAAESIFTIR